MGTQNRVVYVNIAIFLLYCTVINSNAYAGHKHKYDHNKHYFDYYEDKPAHRHDKRRHHKKRSHGNKHRHSHTHTRFCHKQHRRSFNQAQHRHGHHYYDKHNISLGFILRFMH